MPLVLCQLRSYGEYICPNVMDLGLVCDYALFITLLRIFSQIAITKSMCVANLL